MLCRKRNQQSPTRLRCLAVVSVTLAFPALAAGQATDRFNFSFEQLADSNQVQTSSVNTEVYHRFLLDDDGSHLLTAGLVYTQLELKDETLTEPDRQRSLKAIVPEFNWMSILNESYSLVATLRPGFFGDLKGDLGKNFRLEGGILVTRIINDSLTLGFGFGRGSNFARDMVVPLFQFLYFPTDRIVLRGLLPVNASIWYIPNQKWEFGALYRLQGSLFHLEDSNFPEVDQLGFATANIGGAVRRHLFGDSYLSFETGFTVMRRYEWTGERGPFFVNAEEPTIHRDLDPAPYLRIGWQQRL